MMSNRSKQEYTRQVSARYLRATRLEKSRILDEFASTNGYNRKYAVTLLRNPPAVRNYPVKRPRSVTYGKPVVKMLEKLWLCSSCLCSRRLVPFLPDLISALERHGELCITDEIRQKLLAMSPATADRLLRDIRRSTNPDLRGRSTTKPGTLLRDQIKVRTSFGWDEQRPGYFEIDLVAHCADNGGGAFIFTLTMTDIATGWTECDGLLNKSELEVVGAIERIRKRLPFKIRGLDSDNGSEFINHQLKKYCDKNEIEFTRSRPYRKNDQAHVEQKNWTVVRQFIGYARYEGPTECSHLRTLHKWLRIFVNHFQPSMKLLKKETNETTGKSRKKYDKAKTPYKRLLDSQILEEETRADLEEMNAGFNPEHIHEQLRRATSMLRTSQKDRITREATNTQ